MSAFTSPTFTPDEVAYLSSLAEESVKNLLSHVASTATNGEGHPWKVSFIKRELNLSVYSSAVNDSSLLRFKAVCTMPFSIKELVEFTCDNVERLKWDRNVCILDLITIQGDDMFKIEDTTKSTHIFRCATKAVGPISGRDFVDCITIQKLPDGNYVNTGSSIDSSDILAKSYPVDPAFIRGWNSSGSGWYFKKLNENTTEVHYLIHTDLRGWFLPAIINSVIGGSYVSFFEDIINALKNRQNKKSIK